MTFNDNNLQMGKTKSYTLSFSAKYGATECVCAYTALKLTDLVWLGPHEDYFEILFTEIKVRLHLLTGRPEPSITRWRHRTPPIAEPGYKRCRPVCCVFKMEQHLDVPP